MEAALAQLQNIKQQRAKINKAYYTRHNVEQMERVKKRVVCEVCNKEYTQCARKKHEKTKFHQNFFEEEK